MAKNIEQSGKKVYRIVQIEGKMSFRIEELWDGRDNGGTYGSVQSAIFAEEKKARANGFIDELILQEAVESRTSHKDAFEKDPEGNWHCTHGCAIEMANKEIVFSEGMTFTKGTPFMGIDVAKWLEENS